MSLQLAPRSWPPRLLITGTDLSLDRPTRPKLASPTALYHDASEWQSSDYSGVTATGCGLSSYRLRVEKPWPDRNQESMRAKRSGEGPLALVGQAGSESSQYRCLSTFFRIFPVPPLGNSSTNSTDLGTL